MTKFYKKILFISIGLLTIFPAIPIANDTSDENQFIINLYKNYQRSDYQFAGTGADTIFAPELLKLIRMDEENAKGEAGYLDWDPICACQDYEGLQIIKISIFNKDQKNFGEVHLKISETIFMISLELIKINGKWFIKDIKTADVPSLLKYLKSNLKSD